MRKTISLIVFVLFSVQIALGQKTITGKVTGAQDNAPMPGVSVVVKGTTTGTVTDADGKYSIAVPNNEAVLQFSFIGYNTKEITVGTQTVINVALEEATVEMSEIVVTALGIKKESKKLGYAVTSVQTEELAVNKAINVMESLEGKVSGLNISVPTAGAGSSTQIRLRGQVAFAGANNAPLLVINGIPIDQNARSANGYGTRDLGDNLNAINPDDIESMTVLKGATAAAIYGSRAANGAIVITTKSGQRGDQGIGIEFSSSLTLQEALNYWDDDLQTVYGQGRNGLKPTTAAEAAGNGQFGWGAKMDGQPIPIFDGTMAPYSPQPNKLFQYLRTGQNLHNTIAFTGGHSKGSFRASFSNMDVKGIDPFNEYKKNTANIGVVHDITKKVNFNVNLNYSNEKYINPPQVGTQGEGAVNFFTRIASNIPFWNLKYHATDPNTGTEAVTTGFQGTVLNPFYEYQDAKGRYELIRDRYLATATLRYNITDWLFAQGRYNYDYSINFTESKKVGGIGTSQPMNVSDGTYKGSYSVSEGQGTEINSDFLVGANKKFGKLALEANFGGNTYRVKSHNFSESVSNFIVRDFFSIANGTNKTLGYGFQQFRVNSLYGMAGIEYASMIYLNFTGREDWFSVLNPNKNSKFYSSVSGSFVFSELLKDLPWLNYGKLRGSYAQVGSSNGVNVYEGLLTYGISNNQFNGQTLASIGTGTAPNPDLQPFTVTEKELGLELRLLNNRLHFDIAAFDKVTDGQILNVQLSTASGYSSSKKNLGSLKNYGLELLLEYTPIETPNFRWTTSWNHTYLKTKVLSVGVNSDGTPIQDLLVIDFNTTGMEFLGQLHYTVGMPMNMLYTRTYLRNDKGEILVRDNGRLLATSNYVPVGSSIPKYTGGWNNTITYKNLTFNLFFDYKLGGKVLSATLLNMTRQGFSKLSLQGRREGENGIIFPGVYQSTGLPNTTAVTDLQTFYADYRNLQIGDPFVFNSDFVKLRTVSLTYNLTNAIKKVNFLGFIKGLSVTASCRNVLLLYKDMPFVDPESLPSSGDVRAGYENAAYPTTRNYIFSLNAKF